MQIPWKILIVDDDQAIHQVTRMVLEDFVFEERRLELISAYSEQQAREKLRDIPDIALVLLDVVMEKDDSGLELVRYARKELKNEFVRIVLRTGQPGQAPEERVVVDYGINDYRLKTELTAEKMHTTIISALRAYRDLIALEHERIRLNDALKRAGEGKLSSISINYQSRAGRGTNFVIDVPKGEPTGAACKYLQEISAYYHRGNELLDARDLNGAISQYTKMVAKAPENEEGYYLRGYALMEKGNIDAAVSDYSKIIELNDKDVGGFSCRASAYAKLGKMELALSDYNKALELNPQNAEIYFERGNARLLSEDIDNAINDYFKALEIKNLGIYPCLLLMSALKRLKDEKRYELAVKLCTTQKKTHDFGWKILQYYQGEISQERLLAYANSDEEQKSECLCEYHYYLGVKLRANGDLWEARQHFLDCLKYQKTGFLEADLASAELAKWSEQDDF